MMSLTFNKFYLGFLVLVQVGTIPACYKMRASKGGGQVKTIHERKRNPTDIALPPGYKIEMVASGLNFRSGICFDDQGRFYFVEAGYAYGEVWGEPKLI